MFLGSQLRLFQCWPSGNLIIPDKDWLDMFAVSALHAVYTVLRLSYLFLCWAFSVYSSRVFFMPEPRHNKDNDDAYNIA
jgi:hypothetical protein